MRATTINYKGFTHEQLRTAFNAARRQVARMDGTAGQKPIYQTEWKNPIWLLVPTEHKAVTLAALEFYLADEPQAIWLETLKKWYITSKGYQAW